MAGWRPPDVNGIESQVHATRRRNANERPQELRIAGDDGGGHPALTHEPRRAVGIRQHRLQQFGALGQSGLEHLPFRRVDQEGDVAQRPGPLGPGGFLIDAIEHAGVVHMAIGGGETCAELLRPQRREHRQQRLPMGPHAAVAVHHLVENARQRSIARQQRRDIALRRLAVAPPGHAAIRHESGA